MTIPLNPKNFPEKDAHFLIDGPAGVIEVLSTIPKKIQPKGVGVICHPHPLHEGSMTNKVVYTLAKAFDLKGLKTVRFNFRGVGKSEGSFAEGIGETEDLIAVAEWVKKTCAGLPIWLGGFSFGSFVAINGANQMPIAQLFTVAPAVTRSNYQSLALPHCPWTIIQGEEDEIVPPETVYSWYRGFENNAELKVNLIKVS